MNRVHCEKCGRGGGQGDLPLRRFDERAGTVVYRCLKHFPGQIDPYGKGWYKDYMKEAHALRVEKVKLRWRKRDARKRDRQKVQ